MSRQKRLQDLTIKDNFMFGAVMSIEENCIAFLEMVLGFPIEKVVVSKERSMIYHPEYRGVRLDIYARDEKHTHTIMWKCRQGVRRILEKEADIITVRLTWSVLRKGFPMRNCQIPL